MPELKSGSCALLRSIKLYTKHKRSLYHESKQIDSEGTARAGVLNLFSLVYPLAGFKHRIYPCNTPLKNDESEKRSTARKWNHGHPQKFFQDGVGEVVQKQSRRFLLHFNFRTTYNQDWKGSKSRGTFNWGPLWLHRSTTYNFYST